MRKHIIALTLAWCLVLSMGVFPACAESYDAYDSQIYDNQLASYTVISPKDVDNIQSNVVVEDEMLSSESVLRLESTIENGYRVLLLGKSKTESIELMNFPEKETESICAEGLSCIGTLLYEDNEEPIVVGIWVENIHDKSMIDRAINNCMTYDYTKLMPTNIEPNNGWTYTDVDVDSATYDRLTIQASLTLALYDENPIYSGERLQYGYLTADISDPTAPFMIERTKLTMRGNIGSVISRVEPQDQDINANATLSLGVPWSGSISFFVGTDVEISKTAGGIDNQYVTMQYLPTSIFNAPVPTDNGMDCRTCVTSVQTGSKTHTISGTISVTTCQLGNYSQYINYETKKLSLYVYGQDEA